MKRVDYRPFFIPSLNGWYQVQVEGGPARRHTRRISEAEAMAYYDAMRQTLPIVQVVEVVRVVRPCGEYEEGLCGK